MTWNIWVTWNIGVTWNIAVTWNIGMYWQIKVSWQFLHRPECLDRPLDLTYWSILTDQSFLTEWIWCTDWLLVKISNMSSLETYVWLVVGGLMYLDYSVSFGPFMRFSMRFEFFSEMFSIQSLRSGSFYTKFYKLALGYGFYWRLCN